RSWPSSQSAQDDAPPDNNLFLSRVEFNVDVLPEQFCLQGDLSFISIDRCNMDHRFRRRKDADLASGSARVSASSAPKSIWLPILGLSLVYSIIATAAFFLISWLVADLEY